MKKIVVAVGNNDGINPVTSRFFKGFKFSLFFQLNYWVDTWVDTFKEAADYIEEFAQGKETSYNHFEALEYIDDGAVRRWQDLPSIYCVIL